MASGGQCVITTLIKLMLMWRVDSWALLQLHHMEEWEPWGKSSCKLESVTQGIFIG